MHDDVHAGHRVPSSPATSERGVEELTRGVQEVTIGLLSASNDPSRALARIGAVARGAAPLFQQLLGKSFDAVDTWMTSLLGEEFNARMARVPVAMGTGGVDPFGLDPQWARWALASCAFLHRYYFRTEVFGAEHVPENRVLLIANHSGQVPIDGAILGATLFMDVEPPRFIRTMVEKWTQTLPFVSTVFSRVGQVVGVPENAERLLEQEEALLVFPEGVRGIAKTFDKRYQLADFGLGFMRLAMKTNTPIVPIAVVGGEEQYISVANMSRFGKMFGMPAVPIVPQLFIPGGQLPLPTRYRIHIGEPMHFEGDADDDDAVIEEKVWLVRATIQSMVNRGIKTRKHIFW